MIGPGHWFGGGIGGGIAASGLVLGEASNDWINCRKASSVASGIGSSTDFEGISGFCAFNSPAGIEEFTLTMGELIEEALLVPCEACCFAIASMFARIDSVAG